MKLDPTNLSALQGTMESFIRKGELTPAKDHMEFMLTSAESVGVSPQLIFLQVWSVNCSISRPETVSDIILHVTCILSGRRRFLHGERTKIKRSTSICLCSARRSSCN